MIYSEGFAEIINSTISTNRAGFSVSGNAANAEDFRGVVSNEGLMFIDSSTIANNTHSGFTDRQIGNAGELQMSNTIIVGTGNGEECGGSAVIISKGYNLNTDGTCGAVTESDNPFGNAALLALADNGSLGKTHALTNESDAIDSGDCNNGTLSKDQRGVSRPQGGGCDIGAFELAHDDGNNTGEVDTESGGGSVGESDSGGESGTGTGTGNGNGTGSEGESAEGENSTGASTSSDNDASGAETEDESESSTTEPSADTTNETGTDTTNDDTTDGTVVQGSGGGGAMVGINPLLLIILMVVYGRQPVPLGRAYRNIDCRW